MKIRKCKHCTEKKECREYRNVWICKDCWEHYINLKITCSMCKQKIQRKNEYLTGTNTILNFCSEKCYKEYVKSENDKEELINWLLEYHKVEKLNSRIYMQLSKMYKEGKKYKGILLTLKYITDVLKKDLLVDTINLVEWEYSNAKLYYKKKEQKRKELKNTDATFSINGKIVLSRNYEINKKIKEILINEIEFEGDDFFE